MRILDLGSIPLDEVVLEVGDVLRKGGVVGLPTDTVYGVAALPFLEGATEALFEHKARPKEVELPVLAAGIGQVEELTGPLSETALALGSRFWPGPLTLVLRRLPGVRMELGGDGSTIGVRVPAERLVQEVCASVGPIATTSANRHGEAPATTAEELAAALEGVDLVIDGGRRSGTPSTVVSCLELEPSCLREGGLSMEELDGVLGHAGSPTLRRSSS